MDFRSFMLKKLDLARVHVLGDEPKKSGISGRDCCIYCVTSQTDVNMNKGHC